MQKLFKVNPRPCHGPKVVGALFLYRAMTFES